MNKIAYITLRKNLWGDKKVIIIIELYQKVQWIHAYFMQSIVYHIIMWCVLSAEVDVDETWMRMHVFDHNDAYLTRILVYVVVGDVFNVQYHHVNTVYVRLSQRTVPHTCTVQVYAVPICSIDFQWVVLTKSGVSYLLNDTKQEKTHVLDL